MAMTFDEKLDKAEAFQREFKALVRRYIPEYPCQDADNLEVLYLMQDKTSCFTPYIWSDEK